MSTIYTRATKGSALTWTEGDANITNLNNDKMEKSTPVLAGNLDVVTYSITTTTTNGNIVIEPNGTGDVHLVTDALRVGDLNTEARISTYGTGNLVLTTNEGNDPDPTITIGNGANANITLTPSGTGQINLGLTSLSTYKETIYAGGSQASAYTPNYSNGSVHTVTLTGNVTFAAPTNMPAGSSLTLILTQDGTGSRTGTWNASYKWMGGTPTLSTTATAIDVVNVFYDGTNYIAGISKQQASGGGLANVVEDTTPQLGGNLDVQANEITTSVTNGDIVIAPNGTGALKVQTEGMMIGAGTSLAGIVTPDNTSNLILATNDGTATASIQIIAGTNGNIELTPNGTGVVTVSTDLQVNAEGELRLADSDSSHYVGFKSPATVSTNKIWTLPSADGSANQVLSTNGSGTLSWATAGGSSVTMFSFRVSGMTLISGSTYRGDITEIYDPGNVLSITTNQFSLAAGTYLLLCNGHLVGTTNSLRMYNVTDSANISTVGGFDMSATTGGSLTTAGELSTGQQSAITLAATKTVEVRMTRSGAGDVTMSITFIKIA